MKTKMHDVGGETVNYGLDAGKKQTIMPNFTIIGSDLPEIKDLKVGDEIDLKICVKVAYIGQGEPYNDSKENEKKPMRAKFEITKIGMDAEDDGEEDDVAGMPNKSAGMMPGETFGQGYARKRAKGAGDKSGMMRT